MMFKQHDDTLFLAGNDRFEGYLADLLFRLSLSIGFDYEIRLSVDSTYGSPGHNGSWTGMVGEVQRGEADLAAASLTVTPELEDVVAFTDPFLTVRTTAIARKPRRRNARIRSAEDLLRSDMQFGTLANSVTQRLLRESQDFVHRQMLARMATFWPPAYVQTWHEGVEKTRRQNYAFLLDTPQAEYLAGRRPCDLYTTEPFLRRRTYAFALRRGDRLKERINAELFRLREAEEMDLLYMKWWRSECVGGGRKVSARESRDRTTVPNPWRFATASSVGSRSGTDNVRCAAAAVLTIAGVVAAWTVGS
ncbi:hypothetical protein NP493_572g01069 [Ridgeia piscesae]|uniref:Uncharacterized protein n=1 Tax=Ridgeia piscesae TaxID=27915 RepID=A0AAD9NPT1_RIDPI|nr:hypothetical protein NP493_572g01069 [Ridgeia piscesae]